MITDIIVGVCPCRGDQIDSVLVEERILNNVVTENRSSHLPIHNFGRRIHKTATAADRFRRCFFLFSFFFLSFYLDPRPENLEPGTLNWGSPNIALKVRTSH